MYLEKIHFAAGVSEQYAALMVDHYGNPTLRDLDDGDLRTSMAELARYDNVAVNLSGVPTRVLRQRDRAVPDLLQQYGCLVWFVGPVAVPFPRKR